MKNRSKMQMLILALSMIIGGAGTFLCGVRMPECAPAPMAQMAWWGGIYPEYCLSGAVEAVGEDEDDSWETEPRVKICFKYLTFLND